ncbi:uncharacterized protein LOC125177813 [Hyalella azteca]|uniref:Uncharacterized protein LOC125177813 n=1 Tax=Hyalella azteca TaxID=294128 RepID=A0A979FI12_HYAAZ|nr:uncharacterized protein LOC125177813 [Hyalella azteca]
MVIHAFQLQEARSEFTTFLYMMLGSSIGDRMARYNAVLEAALLHADVTTLNELHHYYVMIRKKEAVALEILKASLGICHLKRLIASIFSITNILMFARMNNIYISNIAIFLPPMCSNLAIANFYYLRGQKITDLVLATQEVLQTAPCLKEESAAEINKFIMTTSKSFDMTAGRIIIFNVPGGFLDAQFQFTVVTVLLELYET